MTTLLLLLVVIWLGLIGLLVLWTLFFQGYVYTEPVQGIVWRAPLAGSAVALFLFAWTFFDYLSPGSYRTLLEFSPTIDREPYKELRIINSEGQEQVYKLTKNDRRQQVYKQDGRLDGRELPSTRPQRIIVKENGEDLIFEPTLKETRTVVDDEVVDVTKTFQTDRDGYLYYRNKKTGQQMREDQLGYVTTFHAGNLLINLVLNFLHLAVWFAVLWLLLDFRFWHAAGMAVVAWLALMLFVLPTPLDEAEKVARQQASVKTSSLSPLPREGEASAGLRSPDSRGGKILPPRGGMPAPFPTT